MKIEKISDTQIRCTLNRSDLQSREIKISELAYGTEKAKSLFQDMISQASHQFGFEADDLPLMIEAIPVSPDCIVLIITKVDDPEELDTRFSSFSPSYDSSDDYDDDMSEDLYDSLDGYEALSTDSSEQNSHELPENAEFIPITETVPDITESGDGQTPTVPVYITRMFSFESWSEASVAASRIVDIYKDQSSLYKNQSDGRYYLTVTGITDEKSQFFKACNQLSEYGRKEKHNYATAGYLSEHCRQIIKADAVRILSEY